MGTLRGVPSPLVAKLALGRAPTYGGVEVNAFSFCILVEISARRCFFSAADSAELPLRDQRLQARNIYRARPCKTIRTCPLNPQLMREVRNVQEAVEVHLHGEDIAPEPTEPDRWKAASEYRDANVDRSAYLVVSAIERAKGAVDQTAATTTRGGAKLASRVTRKN